MDLAADRDGGGGEVSLTTALNRDALEEVFVHCSPADLLALRATCSTAAHLLDASEKVWLAKLRESFGLHLKAVVAGTDGLFVRLARRVFEASRVQQLRFQGVFVNGGVDEDAMHYFVDNLFRQDKAPYCSNCSCDADCVALLLDGEVPRDVEFERVRQYMVRRCRYAAALILNVQMPEHNRDPDDIIHILEDWTDIQLEGFFKDLVAALQAEHALGRLLVFDIPHERLASEEQKILGVHQWLLDRPRHMQTAMLKPPSEPNTMLDSSALPKLTGEGGRRLAGVVHEVSLSRVGNLTCPVSAGAVVVGSIDHSKVAGWAPEEVLVLLQRAAADPAAAALNGMQDAGEVLAAVAQGLLPPIVATDQTLAGMWHEFDTSPQAAARQAEAAAAAVAVRSTSSSSAQLAAVQRHTAAAPGPAGPAATAGAEAEAGASSSKQQRQASPAGIITWKPLLWFKFHSANEATGFVQQHRQLIEQHGAKATVRHHGPPTTRSYHVVAAPGEQLQAGQPAVAPAEGAAPGGANGQWHMPHAQQQQQQQQPQHLVGPQQPQLQQQVLQHPQQPPAPQHPQPVVAVGMPAAWQAAQHRPAAAAGAAAAPGMPVPPGFIAPAAGVLVGGAGLASGAPPLPLALAAAGVPVAAGMPEAPVSTDSEGEEGSEEDEEGASDGSAADMNEDDESGDSDSDIDEVAEAAGAWLNNWAQDEFGADLQQEQDVVVAGQGIPFDQMDEGSSSEDEEEDDDHFALGPAAAGGGEAGGHGAGALHGVGGVPGVPQEPVVQTGPAEALLRALTRRTTRARNRLRVPLSRPAGANILLVKLISQENLMEQYGDPHTWPNIDMTFCGLVGRQVELPEGMVLAP